MISGNAESGCGGQSIRREAFVISMAPPPTDGTGESAAKWLTLLGTKTTGLRDSIRRNVDTGNGPNFSVLFWKGLSGTPLRTQLVRPLLRNVSRHAAVMTLLTKPEAEKLLKQASSVARMPATAKDIQARWSLAQGCDYLAGELVDASGFPASSRVPQRRTEPAAVVGRDSREEHSILSTACRRTPRYRRPVRRACPWW
jgi:hypothetical protein